MLATNPVGDVDGESPNEDVDKIRKSVHGATRPASAEHLAIAQGIENISWATLSEVDRLIAELQKIRSFLRSEGERVRGEIKGYVGFSQSAAVTVEGVADTLTQAGQPNSTLGH